VSMDPQRATCSRAVTALSNIEKDSSLGDGVQVQTGAEARCDSKHAGVTFGSSLHLLSGSNWKPGKDAASCSCSSRTSISCTLPAASSFASSSARSAALMLPMVPLRGAPWQESCLDGHGLSAVRTSDRMQQSL